MAKLKTSVDIDLLQWKCRWSRPDSMVSHLESLVSFSFRGPEYLQVGLVRISEGR